MKVKRAETLEEITRMIELGRKMHAESRYAHLPYDEEKLMAYGRDALAKPDSWGVFFAEQDGVTFAMVVLVKMPYYFCTGRYRATDFFLYVDPSRRGGLAAARCIKAAEEWAKEAGIDEICFGVTADINNEAAERFYSGFGYKPSGRMMYKGMR